MRFVDLNFSEYIIIVTVIRLSGHGLTYNVMAGHQITVVTNGAGGEREGKHQSPHSFFLGPTEGDMTRNMR